MKQPKSAAAVSASASSEETEEITGAVVVAVDVEDEE
jgi:hypothetical protein